MKVQHPSAPAVKPVSPEEQEKLNKAAALKKKIEETRKKLQEKYNNDLMKLLKKMSMPDMAKEEVAAIEAQITDVKSKIRDMMSAAEKEKIKAKEQLDAARQ